MTPGIKRLLCRLREEEVSAQSYNHINEIRLWFADTRHWPRAWHHSHLIEFLVTLDLNGDFVETSYIEVEGGCFKHVQRGAGRRGMVLYANYGDALNAP